jgi:hypothetical protein
VSSGILILRSQRYRFDGVVSFLNPESNKNPRNQIFQFPI